MATILNRQQRLRPIATIVYNITTSNSEITASKKWIQLTSVLDFRQSQAIKLGLVAIGHQTERIKGASIPLAGTEIVIKCLEGAGRGLLRLGRGEGGSASKERGKDSKFHGGVLKQSRL